MITRKIFRSYDVRGIYPTEVNEESIRVIGGALNEILPEGEVLVAHDGRHGSLELAKIMANELEIKHKVIFVGLATTPMFYFLVNHFKTCGGAMITASHNPKEYNGVKPVRAAAIPISGTELLAHIDKNNGL